MLIIDNYDSFTYNIVEYVRISGINPVIIKNDEKTLDEISELDFTSIIISPGYGRPENSGICTKIIEKYHGKIPILGICLGHQCIAELFGGKIIEAEEPCHGKISKVYFDESCLLYKGLKQEFNAVRYHSLIVDKNSVKLPLKVNSQTKEGIIMGLEVLNSLTFGVQFHPEAILTDNGIKIIENFIGLSR